jgi:Apea-like HEPN
LWNELLYSLFPENVKRHKPVPTIFQLIKTVKDNFDIFSKPVKGELSLPNQLYIEWNFTFTYDKGITSTNGQRKYIEKTNTITFNQFAFFDEVNSEFPIFDLAVNVITKEFNIERHQAIFNLSSLVSYLIKNKINEFEDSHASDIAVTFVNDLINGPKDISAKVFIGGIWLESERIEVNDGLTVRKPVNEDLKQTVLADLNFHSDYNLLGCGAVLEIFRRKTTDFEIQEHISRLITLLSLFKTGQINLFKFDLNPDSILHFGIFSVGTTRQPIVSNYKYEIKPTDVEILNTFIAKFDPIIVSIKNLPNNDNNKSISIALERYLDSINRPQQIESKITGIITSFESLLLKSNERSELSHRLSQRASYILKQFGCSPIEVYNDLKRAYEIRSTFIHGGISDPTENSNPQNLSDQIVNYIRLSILLFMNNSIKSDKDKLISSIDNAIIDDKAHEKLSKKLNEITKAILK